MNSRPQGIDGAQAGTLLASGLRRSAAAQYSQEGSLQEVIFIQESLCKVGQ